MTLRAAYGLRSHREKTVDVGLHDAAELFILRRRHNSRPCGCSLAPTGPPNSAHLRMRILRRGDGRTPARRADARRDRGSCSVGRRATGDGRREGGGDRERGAKACTRVRARVGCGAVTGGRCNLWWCEARVRWWLPDRKEQGREDYVFDSFRGMESTASTGPR